jgi:hypothetical protein
MKNFLKQVRAIAAEAAIKADREECAKVAELCELRRKPELTAGFIRQGLSAAEALDRLLLIPCCDCRTPPVTAEQAKQRLTVH